MTTTIQHELRSEARGRTGWEIENVYDFAEKDLPQCNAILEHPEHGDVLTEGGILQFTGPGKIGKSTLLSGNMLVGIAIGRDSLSFEIKKPWKVLCFNGENSNKTMKKRCQSWRKYYCIDEENSELMRNNLQFVSGGFPIQSTDGLAKLRAIIKEVAPDVVVIDPLKNFYSGEENSADDMRRFMMVLRALIQEFGISIIIIHHTGKKQNESGSIYTGRGSSLLADDAETTMSFQKDSTNKGLFTLNVIGRNCAEFTIHLAPVADQYFFTITDRPEPLPDHTLIDILDSLPNQFKTGAFEEKAASKSIKRTKCFEKIKILENNGIIARIGKGLYEKIVRSVQNPIGTELNELPDQSTAVVQVVQDSSDCTTRTTEPDDEYRGLF